MAKTVLDALKHLGRYGDNQIRPIDGKPAHVNMSEAAALDALGKIAEPMIKNVGAGTINPQTGLKEYHWGSRPAHWGDHALGRVKGGWNHEEDKNPYQGEWKGSKRIGTFDELMDLYAAGDQYKYIGDVWWGKDKRGGAGAKIREKVDEWMGDWLSPHRTSDLGKIEQKYDHDISQEVAKNVLSEQLLDRSLSGSRNAILNALNKDYPNIQSAIQGSSTGSLLDITDSMNANKRSLLRRTKDAFKQRREDYLTAKERSAKELDFKKRELEFQKSMKLKEKKEDYLTDFYTGIGQIT
tara:strand:+ start:137 stop:1024 length:888 start_codon:yes stop_codon:yes gene_type:complete